MAFVYILRCGDGSLYTGIAKDLARRLAQHEAGLAARYTRSRLPVALVWSCEIETWGDALREEIRIKALPRAKKEALLIDARS
jgi:predicted GIY-YIG superfamily endonuclease